jgi:hypothetical protein
VLQKMEIKYQKNNSNWGISALFEGQLLIFNGPSIPSHKTNRDALILQKKSIISIINIYDLFSGHAKDAWENSVVHAKKRGEELGIETIFLCLLKEPSVKKLMLR